MISIFRDLHKKVEFVFLNYKLELSLFIQCLRLNIKQMAQPNSKLFFKGHDQKKLHFIAMKIFFLNF